MDVCRLDSLLPLDPRVQRAGFWGGVVYLHLLLLNRAHKCEGLIPPQYASPAYLSRLLNLDSAPHLSGRGPEIMRDALRAAVGAALIAIEPDGVRLVDRVHWESESAERVRRHRQKKAAAKRANVSQSADRTIQGGEMPRPDDDDRASMAHLPEGPKTAPTLPVAWTPDDSAGHGVGGPQIARRRFLDDAGVAAAPSVLHSEAGAHAGSYDPEDGAAVDGNVTVTEPPAPLPPPSIPPLLVSPYNPLPYPPSAFPPDPPSATDPVDCNEVTLQGALDIGDGDLELFTPSWMGQDGTASNPLDDEGQNRKPKRELPESAYTLAELLRAAICRVNPQAKIAGLSPRDEAKLLEAWAVVLDKLHRLDGPNGQPWGEIQATIRWAFADPFWQGVITSARQLRERWDQIQAQRVRDRRRGGERAADSSPAPARPRPPAPPPPPPEDRGGPATLAELRALQASVGVAKE